MSDKRLMLAAAAFGVLALGAGGLQLWAYVLSAQPRHLILAVFALAVGGCVLAATGAALRRARNRHRTGG